MVVHNSGQMHHDADCLFRKLLLLDENNLLLVSADTIVDIKADNVADSQQKNPNLHRDIKHLNNPTSATDRRTKRRGMFFSLRDGVLFCRNSG